MYLTFKIFLDIRISVYACLLLNRLLHNVMSITLDKQDCSNCTVIIKQDVRN